MLKYRKTFFYGWTLFTKTAINISLSKGIAKHHRNLLVCVNNVLKKWDMVLLNIWWRVEWFSMDWPQCYICLFVRYSEHTHAHTHTYRDTYVCVCIYVYMDLSTHVSHCGKIIPCQYSSDYNWEMKIICWIVWTVVMFWYYYQYY